MLHQFGDLTFVPAAQAIPRLVGGLLLPLALDPQVGFMRCSLHRAPVLFAADAAAKQWALCTANPVKLEQQRWSTFPITPRFARHRLAVWASRSLGRKIKRKGALMNGWICNSLAGCDQVYRMRRILSTGCQVLARVVGAIGHGLLHRDTGFRFRAPDHRQQVLTITAPSADIDDIQNEIAAQIGTDADLVAV